MLCPNLSPQTNYIARNRIATELYQKLGFQPKSFNRRLNSEFQLKSFNQAQRCTRQLSMIPTNKSDPKNLRIEGTRCARKSNENSSKKTLLFIARSRRRRSPGLPDAIPAIPPRVRRHQSFSTRPDPVSACRSSGLCFMAQPSKRTVLL
jgi:hypothetical protein